MALGKNKRISKGRKGGKKKIIDPFAKKEWYDVCAPNYFRNHVCGKTLVTKSSGKKLAADSLKGRIYDMNLADLNGDEDLSFRKMQLSCEEVRGRSCLTDFHGMSFTRDKLCSLIRKCHSLIEASVDIKTLDNYHLRLFCVGFTMRGPAQDKSTCYARTSQIRLIRKAMVDIMTAEATKVPLKELVKKFIPESIGMEIVKACKKIFPLKHVYIRKVKILKKPKFDLTKLMELHQFDEDQGKETQVETPAEEATDKLLHASAN